MQLAHFSTSFDVSLKLEPSRIPSPSHTSNDAVISSGDVSSAVVEEAAFRGSSVVVEDADSLLCLRRFFSGSIRRTSGLSKVL